MQQQFIDGITRDAYGDDAIILAAAWLLFAARVDGGLFGLAFQSPPQDLTPEAFGVIEARAQLLLNREPTDALRVFQRFMAAESWSELTSNPVPPAQPIEDAKALVQSALLATATEALTAVATACAAIAAGIPAPEPEPEPGD